MKILMLGWELPPHNSGGLGIACLEMCKSLAAKGADIEFVLPYTAEHNIDFMKVTAAHPQNVEAILKSGIAYDSYQYVYSDGTSISTDIFGQQLMFEVAAESLAASREFDVIHAHDWLTFRAALRVKEKSNCPLILHVHSIERDRAGSPHGNPIVKEIEATAFQIADRIIAVSQHTKNMIVEDYGIPADKIDVVHNSIDNQAFEPLDSANSYAYLEYMKEQGYGVVSNTGRLTLQKGLPNLLRAARQVVEYLPKTLFLITGSGEMYHELIRLSTDLSIGRNVIFNDFQRGKKWRDAFAIADLFVMPSVSEPFGLTPLEAIGYGTPTLISKQSGVAEVLNQTLKVDFWDEKEMANQMVGALRSKALRQELLSNAQQQLARLSWDEAADRILEIYAKHHPAVLV